MPVPTLVLIVAAMLQDPFDVKVARDKSLSIEAYTKLGVPDPGRAWTPADYAKTVGVFQRLVRDDSCKLPRRDSPASGKLWARFISDENLGVLRDEKRALKERQSAAQDLNDAVAKAMTMYGKPAPSGGFDHEAVDLMDLMLRLDVIFFELMAAQAKVLTGDPEKKMFEKRMEQLRQGVGIQIVGALIMLGDLENVRTVALIRFARSFKVTLPKLAPDLLPEHREPLPKFLEEAIGLHENPELKLELKAVLKAVREATKTE